MSQATLCQNNFSYGQSSHPIILLHRHIKARHARSRSNNRLEINEDMDMINQL